MTPRCLTSLGLLAALERARLSRIGLPDAERALTEHDAIAGYRRGTEQTDVLQPLAKAKSPTYRCADCGRLAGRHARGCARGRRAG